MVASASGWLCTCERDGDGWLVVPDIPELVGESDCAKSWRRETLSASRAVLSGINLGGLYTRMRLEFDRIGAADADLYCVALM